MAAKLRPKQARFVEEFLIDLNATQAAIRAGYSAKTARQVGSENLAKPYIQEAVQKAMAERSECTKITQHMVVNGLLAEARRMGDGSRHSARVSAWAHLGRHLLMFSSAVGVENAFDVIREMPDDELDKRIKELEDSIANSGPWSNGPGEPTQN